MKYMAYQRIYAAAFVSFVEEMEEVFKADIDANIKNGWTKKKTVVEFEENWDKVVITKYHETMDLAGLDDEDNEDTLAQSTAAKYDEVWERMCDYIRDGFEA